MLDGVVTTDVVIGNGVVRAALLSETNKATVSMVATLYVRTMIQCFCNRIDHINRYVLRCVILIVLDQ